MAKTYEIHYSTKNHYSGSSASALTLAATDTYLVGRTSTGGKLIHGVHCLFDGLENIIPSAVTSVKLYYQRIEGGSPIDYTVRLAYSVLTESIGETISISSDSSIYYTNRTTWNYSGTNAIKAGDYLNTTIDISLFDQLRDYGWFYTSLEDTTATQQNRSINIADVYLVVETTEIDYELTFDANGGTSAPAAQTLTGVDSATGTITMDHPVRDNHIFKGWATSATATEAQYQPGDTITISANTTLYAVWAVSSVIRIMTADGLKQGQVYVQTADGMQLGIVYVQTQNGLIQSN